MPTPQLILPLHRELIIDNFAGGGGASTGIERALGRYADHAINHNAEALGMHRINHVQTVHHCEDVFEIDPATLTEGRPVGLVHFSPDCRHFSKAKGGKPVEKRIRGLCLVMLRYAKIRARVMTMENVEEIVTWGPLKQVVKKGVPGWYPDEAHKGRTWQAFLACLGSGIDPDHPDLPEILEVLGGTVTKEDCVRGFGYHCESRILRACDYGAPTIRKRFFMICRLDGRPIVWPAHTHGNPKLPSFRFSGLRPWRTIAECIDWQLPCPSIFLTGDAARAARCKRPLAPATLRRIAKGIERYVLKTEQPFLVSLTHQGGDRIEPTDSPIATITGAHRGEKAVVDTELAHFITQHAHGTSPRSHSVENPLPTACAGVKGGHFALVSGTVVNTTNGKYDAAPSRAIDPSGPVPTITSEQKFGLAAATFVQTGYGEREGQDPRALDPEKPLGTVVAGGCKAAVVTGTLIGAGGPAYSGKPKSVEEPMNSQTTENHSALVSATLVHTAHGEQDKAGNPRRGRGSHGMDESMPSICASPDMALAAAHMIKLHGTSTAAPVDDPMHTASAGGQHHAVVAASCIRHFGQSIGQGVEEPAPTVVAGGQGKTGLLTAVMAQHNGGFNTTPAHAVDEPVSTLNSTGSQQQLVAASLAAYYGTAADGQAADDPARTITAKARQCLVESTAAACLTPAQLAGAQAVAAFLRAHGVQFEGDYATVAGHIMIDIGMRMLTPRELYLAQGFPPDYIIDRAWIWNAKEHAYHERPLTKEAQIRMCGNSVSPPPFEALIRANVPELILSSGTNRKPSSTRRTRIQGMGVS